MELNEPITFQWDEGNKAKILRKHGISPKQAEEVFRYKLKKIFNAVLQLYKKEKRYILIGQDYIGRYIFIVFTIREDKVRIISARYMHKKERLKYEKIT